MRIAYTYQFSGKTQSMERDALRFMDEGYEVMGPACPWPPKPEVPAYMVIYPRWWWDFTVSPNLAARYRDELRSPGEK